MAETIDDDLETGSDKGQMEGYEQTADEAGEGYPLELPIRDERRTAQDVARRIKQGRFVLDPDFQRDFVWDGKRQSRLIESVLMRIPLPVFYVAEDTKGHLIVVDGRQRLTTFQRFFAGELELDLENRPEFHGKKFDDLETRLQNRVEDCQLHFYIIDHAVGERVRLEVFERVNGGEVLTRQQMRNALYCGPATVFLREEATSALFAEATQGSLDSRKMQDREFVNRFCAFKLLPLEKYEGDMDQWLAWGLMKLAKLDDEEQASLRLQFRQSLENNVLVFGKHAFRKHRTPDQPRSRINASLFDVMTTGLSTFEEAAVADRADALRQAFYARMDDPEFEKSITYWTNRPAEVKARFEIAATMFHEVFHAA